MHITSVMFLPSTWKVNLITGKHRANPLSATFNKIITTVLQNRQGPKDKELPHTGGDKGDKTTEHNVDPRSDPELETALMGKRFNF